MRTRSPVFSSAIPPLTAASGDALRIDGEPDVPVETAGRPAYAEVREALGALGYGPAEIKTALAALPPDAGASSTEDLLRLALRGLGSSR